MKNILLFSILLAFTALPSLGQELQQGYVPYGSFDFGTIDSVNLQNRNLSINIPIVTYKQKGSLPDFGLKLMFWAPQWTTISSPYGCDPGSTTGSSGGSCSEYTYTVWDGTVMGMSVTANNVVSFGETPSYDSQGNLMANGEYYTDPSGANHYLSQNMFSFGNNRVNVAIDGSGWTDWIDPNGIAYVSSYTGTSLTGYTETDLYGNSVATDFTSGEFPIPTGWTDSTGRFISNGTPGWEPTTSAPCLTVGYPGVGAADAYPVSYCFSQQTFTQPPGMPTAPYISASWVLTSVGLPNNQAYTFTYGQSAELKSIGLPTGGSVSYTYMWTSPPGGGGGTLYPAVTTRTEFDGSKSQTWNYNTGQDPNGNATNHVFDGNGYEVETDYFNGPVTPISRPASCGTGWIPSLTCLPSAENLLKSVITTYQPNGVTPSGTGYELPQSKITVLNNGMISETVYTYDTTVPGPYNWDSTIYFWDGGQYPVLSFGSLLQQDDYDFGLGAPGPLLRTTTMSYQWQNNINYLLLRSLPFSSRVADGPTGTLKAQTKYLYDEPSYLANANGTQFFGKPTTVTSGLGANAVTTHTSYRVDGMIGETFDAKGCGTQIFYQYNNSVPYQTINCLSEITQYGYDQYSGLPTSVQTPNDLAAGRLGTQYSYTPMKDLQSITYPDGGSVSASYSYQSPLSVTVTTQASPDPPNTTSTVYNGLGRPTSTSSAGITSETTYDGLGKVATVTNPHLSTPSPTDGITYKYYDGLGQLVQQVQADNTSLWWCYNGVRTNDQPNCHGQIGSSLAGSWIDSADETGRNWHKGFDALGRLRKVLEPNAANAPALETDYQYDALGNLLRVDQWGGAAGATGDRVRTFSYDSLSHLLLATNPESGSICYGTTGGVAPTSSNCHQNGYDLNGNLVYKTDARGVQASMTYDSLNRLISKTYQYDPQNTLSSCFQYGSTTAAPSNGIDHLLQEWTIAGSCAGSAPASGYRTSHSFLSFDAMGRATGEEQCHLANCVSGTPYSSTMSYNLLGSQHTYTNGVQSLTLTNGYDAMGHLQTVNGSQVNTIPTTTLYFGRSYSPAGATQDLSLGSGINVTFGYDSRLRLTNQMATNP
ncbi:YD repeat-containing protein [Granulicella rosea]|uniref:YD repeat-containing protein n=1 Tax=Granulicella rosea TaxID=474952 RepID=A0A239MQK6_9BACT|nr:RHS repeat protein [Granulicella rosea]SNT44412.1 YD repeat-containing protein [Granulicella rosea]